MPREKRLIEKNDIIPLDVYTRERKEIRKKIVEFKKNRRIPLGLLRNFLF